MRCHILSTVVITDQLYKEVPLCIFGLSFYISFVYLAVLWNEHGLTEKGEMCKVDIIYSM